MTFSLFTDNWIPARFSGGETRWIALHEIVADPAPLDVDWGRPELRTSTYELLIGLFALALADRLTESDDWADLHDTPPSPEELTTRLAPLAPYLTLDGEGARFAQDAAELADEVRAPDALLLDSPGDNTLKNGADIFAKRGRFPALSRKAAAVVLYAMQTYAPSGGAGHRTSMRGGGPLTTLVVPEPERGQSEPTLWRRIVANLPMLRDERAPPKDLGLVFPWAKPTRLSTGGATTECGPDAHWLQCYFGTPRRIRLVFEPNAERRICALTGDVDDVIVTGFRTEPWGVSYGVWRHPLSPYYPVKGGPPLPIHAQSGRIGYRDWTGHLFSQTRATQVTQFENAFPRQRDARLSAMGFVTDNMKALDWVEAEAPLFLLSSPDARARMAAFARERLVKPAETVAYLLRSALRDALGADTQKTLVASATERLWIETDAAFFATLDAAADRLRGFDTDADEDDVAAVDLAPLAHDWLERTLRPCAIAIFEETAPVDQLGDLEESQVARIVKAARSLHSALRGYGPMGRELFAALDLAPPESKSAKAPARQGAPA